jgi:hypothetical protein
MSDEKSETLYPIRSLHDFLFELDKEWSKFRNGTIIGLISSGVLFLVVIFLILRIRAFGPFRLVDFILFVFALIFLAYSIYAMYSQYRFFNKWERRVGLLIHIEDELLAKKLGETSS